MEERFLESVEAEQQPQPQPKPQNQETDQPQPAVPQFETRELVISAYSADDSSTKSSRGDDGKFYWSKGDEISVFYGNGIQGGARFTSTITTDRAEQSDFTGTITVAEGETHDEYWAIYPYISMISKIKNSPKRISSTWASVWIWS